MLWQEPTTSTSKLRDNAALAALARCDRQRRAAMLARLGDIDLKSRPSLPFVSAEGRRAMLAQAKEAETAKREKFAAAWRDMLRLAMVCDGDYENLLTHGEIIMRQVIVKHGLTKGEFLADRRNRKFTYARHEFCWRCSKETRMSLPKIGKMLGRDYTTVINSIRRWQEILDGGGR